MIKKYAELKYGKVNYIIETTKSISELATIFSPATEWVDITGMDVKTGDVVKFVDGILQFITPDPIIDPKAILTNAAQEMLDTRAQNMGYDNIFTASTYVASTVDKFKKEATALVAWRDSVWTTCYLILDDVLAGNRPIPTIMELLEELPKFNPEGGGSIEP